MIKSRIMSHEERISKNCCLAHIYSPVYDRGQGTSRGLINISFEDNSYSSTRYGTFFCQNMIQQFVMLLQRGPIHYLQFIG